MSLAELQPDRKRVFVQKQRANVYTMMLILAFMEIVIGCLFLYLEMNDYKFKVKIPEDAKYKPAPAVGFDNGLRLPTVFPTTNWV